MRNARLLALALMAAPLVAQAQVSPTPAFNKAEHVYVSPPGWDAPTITNDNLTELRGRAAQLKYPFYVVIIRDIDCGAGADVCMDLAIESIAGNWVERGFHPETSQMFLLAPTARKFRIHIGDTYKAGGVVSTKYHDIFKSNSSSGAVKNPGAGILAVMQAVDRDIFEKADPEVLAARRIEEAERARRQVVAGLRGELLAAVARTESLGQDLAADAADRAEAAALSKAADPVASLTDLGPDDITRAKALLDQIRPVEAKLQAKADARKSAALWGSFSNFMKWFALLGAITAALVLLARRRRRRFDYKIAFEARLGYWNNVLAEAHGREDEFTIQASDLSGYSGQTAVLINDLNQLVAQLGLMVKAQEQNVRAAEALVAGAGRLSVEPYTKALAKIDGSFVYTLAEEDGTPFAATRELAIDPNDFVTTREARYAEAREVWSKLTEALKLRATPAGAAVSDLKFPVVLAEAQKLPVFVVPEWFSQHAANLPPSAVNDLDRLRVNDIVAYADFVERQRVTNDEVRTRLEKLVAFVSPAARCMQDDLEVKGDVAIDNDDDNPAITFRKMQAAMSQLDLLVRRVGEGAGFEETLIDVKEQVKHITKLRGDRERQVENLNNADKIGREAVGRAYEARDKMRAAIEELLWKRAAALAVHKNVPALSPTAQGAIRSGERKLGLAEQALGERRGLGASRLAQQAAAAFNDALDGVRSVLKGIGELDQAKLAFERRMRELPQIEARARSKVQKVRRRRINTPIVMPVVITEGPMDYLFAERQARQAQDSWEATESAATSAIRSEKADDDRSSYSYGDSSSSSSSSSYSSGSDYSNSSNGGSFSSGGAY